MKINLLSLLGALGALTVPATLANHVDFLSDAGPFTLSVDAAGTDTASDTQTGSSGNIIGAEREVTLRADLGQWTATYNGPATAADAPNAGSFIGVTGDQDALGTMTLLYDGAGSAGLGGLNFDAAWDLIRVDLPVITGSLDLRLTIADSDGDTGTASIGSLTSGGLYDFSFTDSNYTNFNVDFTKVQSIQLDIETIDMGSSYTLNALTREVVVPEPSSGLLAAFAGCMLLMRRRRA